MPGVSRFGHETTGRSAAAAEWLASPARALNDEPDVDQPLRPVLSALPARDGCHSVGSFPTRAAPQKILSMAVVMSRSLSDGVNVVPLRYV